MIKRIINRKIPGKSLHIRKLDDTVFQKHPYVKERTIRGKKRIIRKIRKYFKQTEWKLKTAHKNLWDAAKAVVKGKNIHAYTGASLVSSAGKESAFNAIRFPSWEDPLEKG